MRVIAGQSRGRKLVSAEGKDTRPTTDRVKESMFNLLAPYVCGANVLDLFAGSGALGIEALSRGAEKTVFVEKNAASLKNIEINLENTHLKDKAEVIFGDFENYLLKCSEKFDLVLLDPPYSSGVYGVALDLLGKRGLLTHGAVVALEHSDKIAAPQAEGFEIYTDRKYGSSMVAILKYV